MAVNTRPLFPLRQAKARRSTTGRYFDLDGSRYLLGAVVILCLVSLIALGQTGVVATKGYAITQLESTRTTLLRERSQLQLRLAAAKSLDHIQQRAEAIGLRPMTDDQARYITIPAAATPVATTPTPVKK